MKKRLLSKSKYLNGLQCPKYLWLLFNDKGKIPQLDTSTQHVFDEGHRIGELAKSLFPDGINISSEDFIGNLNKTRELLSLNRPLFEPGFYVEGYYSRLDILNPVGDGEWDVFEVKGSTTVKDINIHDVSFQRHCLRKAGLSIRRCFIVYINNRYVKNGDIDPQQLFTIEDVTEQIDDIASGVEDRSEEMWEVIASPTCPEVGVGPHCSDPYDCPVTWCWDSLPENNIFDLYRGGKKCFDMLNKGIFFVKEIPADIKLSAAQQIQQTCEIDEQPHIDNIAIEEFINSLQYPLYYLDFETFNPAIPIYDGTRPYQQVPFQFSLHVVNGPGLEPEHYGFLGDGTKDPRPAFLAELQRVLGVHGNIVVYNQSFEKGILSGLGGAFPEYADWIQETCDRVIDLYAPFRNFSYYHPMQQGSASIKKVMPALTGKGYDGLNIAQGDDASMAFFNMAMGTCTGNEKTKVMKDLEVYCALDTEGMIWIVDKLESLCR
ncbi:DUF2779 domain-containing protein [Chloroflexota bacterium]